MKINTPMDVVTLFPVRKSGAQKQAFREAVQAYLEKLGYCVSVEQGSFHSRNVVAGDPNGAKFLVTAHYDTCARMLIPNLITPCNLWLFLGYQLLVCLLLFIQKRLHFFSDDIIRVDHTGNLFSTDDIVIPVKIRQLPRHLRLLK